MNIIVHAYLTDGFFELAKTFVESYFLFNDIPMHLDTRGLTEEQCLDLVKIVNNKAPEGALTLSNRSIDYNDLSQKTGINVPTLKRYKSEVENRFGLPANELDMDAKVWKLLHAGEARIKAMYAQLKQRDAVIQFDIDTLFRGNISVLKQLAERFDFAAKIRLGNTPKIAISIGLVIYQNTRATCRWIDQWLSIIDSVPPVQRPLGFGQISCYNAFQVHKDNLKYIDLIKNYPRFGIPWTNGPTDLIWTANTHGVPKSAYAQGFRDEIKRLKNASN
jgi:hypothetical protein